VLRDPTTGQELVALRRRVFEEAWQDELVAGAATTARAVLRERPSVDGTVELARSAMAGTSRLAEGLLARAPAGAVACRSGCDHCCHQSVGVTPPEALAIWQHLSSTLSSSALAEVASHVAATHDRTRGLASHDRYSPDQPCAFLRESVCTIYEVRPLACRGMNSFDADLCARRLRDPATRSAFLADPAGLGPSSFLEPIRAFHAISAGLQLGLAELYGLDMRPLDLAAALDLLLSGPASQAQAWIDGGSPFASARGGDSSHQPGIHRLSGALHGAP
jgi:Fe-S-cluster containining protein